MTTALVSGASVAGLATAYWLEHQGYSVTVVERYDGPRPGGQAIDVRGPALDILDRMGLLQAAADKKTNIRGASFVDANGNELSRDTEATPTGGVIDNPDIEILRDDLVDLLRGALSDDVDFIFGDSITGLDDRGDVIAVSFERADAREVDLVVGADGLHSNVRRLTFGPETQFIRPIATFMAIFTVPNFLNLDYWQTFHQSDKTMAGVYSARNNAEARAMFAFMDPDLRLDYRNTAAQFAELDRRMAHDGWVRPQLLEYMRTAPDFYFDGLAQIIMGRWAHGRVVLAGDAAHCSSPMSGQGTSLALLGAYILAGELASAGHDHQRGLANYDAAFRPYVERTQVLVDLDQGMNGGPIAPDDFYNVVHSIELQEY